MGQMRHMTVDLERWVRKPLTAYVGMFKHDDGTPVPPDEAQRTIYRALAVGFEVLPVCDNYDERGYCLGHDQ